MVERIKSAAYIVIFRSRKKEVDQMYNQTFEHLKTKVQEMEGFLGIESFTDASGLDLTVSYWKDSESIRIWAQEADHIEAKTRGRDLWYANYYLFITKVENHSFFSQ